MEEVRTPKVLEKTPVVWGFHLGKVAVLLGSGMWLLFLGFYDLLMALTVPAVGGVYFFIETRFPRKGEFIQYITYSTGIKCIHCNQQIKSLIKR